jgi:hypothetical protein
MQEPVAVNNTTLHDRKIDTAFTRCLPRIATNDVSSGDVHLKSVKGHAYVAHLRAVLSPLWNISNNLNMMVLNALSSAQPRADASLPKGISEDRDGGAAGRRAA